nr:SET and MYND domain-containing protein 4-like [Procambarus clarkii]
MAYAYSFESLSKQFIHKLLVSSKIREIIDEFGPEHTTEEMFSSIWSLDEAHSTLSPVLLPPSKSNEVSYQHSRKGDKAYVFHDLDEALKCYNLAVLSAPHPDIVAGNVQTHDKKVYKALAHAYGSRSLVLFNLKQYEKCLDDIERVLQLDSLQVSTQKFREMKVTCQKMILKDKDKKRDITAESNFKSSELSFAYTNPDPPKLKECNSTVPSLSSAVKLVYTDLQGRHLIADKDINPGEIVSVDDGYCTTVFTEMLKMYCTVCVKRCMAPLPCPTCNMVIFCSEECRTRGLSDVHFQECPIMPTLCALDMGRNPALAYRIMMKTTHAKLKEMIPLLQHDAKNQPPKNLGFNKNRIYDAADYTSVYHLKTNKEKRSSKDLLRRCIQAFIITKLLQLSGRYFISCDGEPFTPSLEDIILTGSTLIHHMMNLICNARAIGFLTVALNNSGQSHETMCGCGVYSASSLMNHSCNANCTAVFYGKTEVVRAIQFIPAGKPLTILYGESFAEEGTFFRRLTLKTQYHFTCTCEACENNWPTCMALSQLILLMCTKCNEAINSFTKICPKCQLKYDQREVPGRQSMTPYNYRLISRKIQRVQEDYLIAKYNILVKGSNADKDIKVVRTLIKLFCKYVKQPCFLLIDAMHTLCFVFDKRGACVYVNAIEPPCSVS